MSKAKELLKIIGESEMNYKGYTIEKTGKDHNVEYRITTADNELLSTYFDSIEKAKQYIDKRVQRSK